MLIIRKRKKENVTDKHYINNMLKRFKRKVRDVRQLNHLRENEFFTKPSDKKREEKQKNIMTIKYKDKNNEY
ncbi:30S ribosomal protein S21 [Candidatus Wolfebacteria bacterium]|nr:MAG: 30S ribosomal protein S21 [Candidatus Wolfebacteria bacterium]